MSKHLEKLSEENIKNLKLLSDYLINNKEESEFDMNLFSENETVDNLCGSSGCAIGHASFIIPVDKKFVNIDAIGHVYIDWEDYCESVFGFSYEKYEYEYHWCFSANWSSIDNTRKGAGLRINWFLDHGLPENFSGKSFIYSHIYRC